MPLPRNDVVTIYMVRALSGDRRGQIKIGRTRFPEIRFREICRMPDVRGPIEVIWARLGPTHLEQRMHRHFEKFSMGNEWFNLSRRAQLRYMHRTSSFPRVTIHSALRRDGLTNVMSARALVETARRKNDAPTSAVDPCSAQYLQTAQDLTACAAERLCCDTKRSAS